MDIVLTKTTNIIAINVTSTASALIIHKFILTTILLLIATIICYQYAKQKMHCCINRIKWKITN